MIPVISNNQQIGKKTKYNGYTLVEKTKHDNGRYKADDISFYNINQIYEARNHYIKHGVYTKLDKVRDKLEYKEYWDNEELKRRYGVTIPGRLVDGKVQEVYIPGELYGYLNYGQIMNTPKMSDADEEDMFGELDEEEDDNFTGILKTKVARKEKFFPDFWDGDYHFFNARLFAKRKGLNMAIAKARRKGYTYKGAWIAMNNYDLHPNSTTLVGAYDTKYLYRGDGIMTIAKNYMDFINKNTDWRKSRITNLKDEVISGYRERGREEIYGYQSKVIAVTFRDNPDAAIGKDASEILIDESGKFPNLMDMMDVTLPTTEDGGMVTGMITLWGTGGTKEANWEQFESIFYEPDKYRCMVFENVWDDNTDNTGCGFFIPYIQNLKPLYDENGNSDYIASQAYSDQEIERAKEKIKDIQRFNTFAGQRCNKPKEAFSRSTVNIFSSIDLDNWVEELRTSKYAGFGRTGYLTLKEDGQVRLQMSDAHPIVPYPHKDSKDKVGCVVEWQPPFKVNGIIPKKLYRIWNDPYAHNKDKEHITTKNSLGATYVYEKVNNVTHSKGDILVASYIGRPDRMDDYNEQLLRLAIYYNAEVMYENDRGDVYNHFKKRGYLHLLADEPGIVWDKELIGKGSTGREKGISMNENRKIKGATYLRDWLYMVRGKDGTGIEKLNLHYVYDIHLLKELQRFNLKGNFDRASAMLVGQYDIKEQFQFEVEIINSKIDTNSYFNRARFQ